ncbi:hypothetical protein DW651_03170 [Subdoligranulum sp. AM23-21AC]|nr:hypothetical protein DW651_03170 [Subdoligranulum sp. AM23-21AC]
MRPAGRRGAFKAKLRRRPPCAANGAKRLFGSTLAKKQFFSKMKQAVRLEKTGGPFYTGNIGVQQCAGRRETPWLRSCGI